MRHPQRSHLVPIFLPAAASCHDICWRPAADIYRTCTGWLVKFDLAGVRLDDMRLEIQGRLLSVSGTRRDWLIEQGYFYHSMEIAYSHFERHIEFPEDLQDATINTDYQAGMLLVDIQTGRRAHE